MASYTDRDTTKTTSERSSVTPEKLLILCRSQRWSEVKEFISSNPRLTLEKIKMENHNWTSILHQVITSKSSDISARYSIIKMVLTSTPDAAAIANGYGSLPLHVVSQRNIKMDAPMKEKIILALIKAYPQALHSAGGVGKRTPLHIAFTDYVSSRLIKTMIQFGKQATTMKDKNSWLPIHVACSRHCSPEKLLMLLQAYPESIDAKTNDGETPLSLAISTATSSHPNHKLIQALRSQQPAPASNTNVQQNPFTSYCIHDRSKRVKFDDDVEGNVATAARTNCKASVAFACLAHRSPRVVAPDNRDTHNIHGVEQYSEQDKEQALNLLLLQSGFLDNRRFPSKVLQPIVTPSPSFPLPPHCDDTAMEIQRTTNTAFSTPSDTWKQT